MACNKRANLGAGVETDENAIWGVWRVGGRGEAFGLPEVVPWVDSVPN